MNHVLKPVRTGRAPLVIKFFRRSTTSQGRSSDELLKERYQARVNEDEDKKRARLVYQSRKRGMLENGVILASFADRYLHQFNSEQLDEYDKLINLPTNDWDIFYWATKTKPTPPQYETPTMKLLREHLKSKVSKSLVVGSSPTHLDDIQNESNHQERASFYNKRPDDIAMPALKSKYPLNIDITKVDPTNYENELYDNRVKQFQGGKYMQLMTDWRKRFFAKRIRRTISAPISVRNMSDKKQVEVYTQRRTGEEDIACKEPLFTGYLIDSRAERNLKHHNFVQELLKSRFTDDAQMYDDEAEAWSDMLWHRNYGTTNVTLKPSQINCFGCSARIQCCDSGLDGYIPSELFLQITTSQSEAANDVLCQRCKLSKQFNTLVSTDVDEETFHAILLDIRSKPASIVCLLIDLTDFPSGIIENLIGIAGIHHKYVVVGNKIDLLPYEGSEFVERVTKSLKENLSKLRLDSNNLHIKHTLVISARTGFGVENLIAKLLMMNEKTRSDMYLIGSGNSGKSTLFNALLQSDLSQVRKGDLMGRISSYSFPSAPDVNMFRFPIAELEGWQAVLKRRKSEIVERNSKRQEKALASTSKLRQANAPHMSTLLNRLDYSPLESPSDGKAQLEQLMLSQDHPFLSIEERRMNSATRDEFPNNCFFHIVPSTSNKEQLHHLLTLEEHLRVFPNETIIPRKYSIRPLQSIMISGLARLDMLTSQSSVLVTVFASQFLPIHVIQTRKADQFYHEFLGSPYLGIPTETDTGSPVSSGRRQRLDKWPGLLAHPEDFYIKALSLDDRTDIVLGSAIWVLVGLQPDQECIVRAYSPKARGIYCRQPALLDCKLAPLKGKKIRNTPLFQHPHYRVHIKH